MTPAETAAQLGVSPQAVYRIEVAALAKCRRWCDEHGITLDDLLDDPADDTLVPEGLDDS